MCRDGLAVFVIEIKLFCVISLGVDAGTSHHCRGLDALLATCVVPVEHSWAGALWLSGLKQILLTHNVVSQYHSKPIWHAILSVSLSLLMFSTVYCLIREENKGRSLIHWMF